MIAPGKRLSPPFPGPLGKNKHGFLSAASRIHIQRGENNRTAEMRRTQRSSRTDLLSEACGPMCSQGGPPPKAAEKTAAVQDANARYHALDPAPSFWTAHPP